jgi:hypothetical protein
MDCMENLPGESDLPAALQDFDILLNSAGSIPESLHAGMVCPSCSEGILDYDGLLNLACPVCGFQSGAGAGCT